MSYKKLIKDTLAPLGIPVAFQNYSGDATTYITYSCYLEQGEEWAEDVEIATGFYVQVDIWAKVDYTIIEGQVKNAMISAGFKRTSAQDFYENDTKTYHKALRFFMLSN